MARLRMTNADYVAIAVSPALVMALVGSLVFFLIEVLYVGGYSLRLNYVFALFVFATVLIARIAIEFGAERAAMYSLPLGVLTFLALQRFVAHSSPLSWIINLALLAVVWWCAHKLTWDCTLIDDNEDASGEGLLGQVGLDAGGQGERAGAVADNELLADAEPAPWWRRVLPEKKGPHTPGVWVLYFSLAALPLFGIGQWWIPAAEIGRRRYAFALLAVYVAAALSLLVTTSFLGLRRYLRQRRVEMPAPMAATWVSLGAVLIVLVMFAAALIPRPAAEYAVSQPPWQAGSPDDLSASRYSVGGEGTDDPESQNRVTSDEQEGPPTGEARAQQDSQATSEQGDGEGAQQSQQGEQGSTSSDSQPSDSSNEGQSKEPGQGGQPAEGQSDVSKAGKPQETSGDEPSTPATSTPKPVLDHAENAPPPSPALPQVLQALTLSIANVLKLLFYAVLAAAICYFIWRNREAIARAVREFIQQIRDFFARLFGGGRAAPGVDGDAAAAAPRRRTFAEFSDPFASGRHRQLPPVELVRYTFEAFEAWAGDRGRPRAPHETPQELVHSALAPQTPMYAQARTMARLYSEAAYASGAISREAALALEPLWQMMRSQTTGNRALRGQAERVASERG